LNLKVLVLLLLYYGVLSLVFASSGSIFNDNDFTYQVVLNDSVVSENEIDTGGLFGTGVDFGRYLGFVTIGIGLPGDTPGWFQLMFSLWQSAVLLFSLGFVISSIWDG